MSHELQVAGKKVDAERVHHKEVSVSLVDVEEGQRLVQTLVVAFRRATVLAVQSVTGLSHQHNLAEQNTIT